MIDIITYDDGLPISVIIPHTKDKIRDDFFRNFTLPLIEANQPIEIIINDDFGLAPKKRNAGFLKSTQPFVFFCDNDILLPSNHLEKLLEILKKNPDKAYAYSGYKGIVLDNTNHPLKGNFQIPTIPFNSNRLKQGNYISTMSLIRREKFPMFDESIKRLQDYDLWLTMLERGDEGVAVFDNEFFAYYLDSGITSNSNSEVDAINIIKRKHNI
jgi:hypothetical protein